MLESFFVFLTRLITGCRVIYAENNSHSTQKIYFANHGSHLDFLLIWSSLPKHLRIQTKPVAAKDYWGVGTIKKYLSDHVFRSVLIPRQGAEPGEKSAMEEMTGALAGGFSLVIFPEGTRNLGTEMLPFRAGIYYLAKQFPNVELIPVYLENLNRIMPKGEILPVPFLGRIKFGAAIQLLENESKEDFLVRSQEKIKELMSL